MAAARIGGSTAVSVACGRRSRSADADTVTAEECRRRFATPQRSFNTPSTAVFEVGRRRTAGLENRIAPVHRDVPVVPAMNGPFTVASRPGRNTRTRPDQGLKVGRDRPLSWPRWSVATDPGRRKTGRGGLTVFDLTWTAAESMVRREEAGHKSTAGLADLTSL